MNEPRKRFLCSDETLSDFGIPRIWPPLRSHAPIDDQSVRLQLDDMLIVI
jgi:hypothetical protein